MTGADPTGAPVLRPATAADADAVGALHADSWRRHYRGAYRDEFLDGDVDGDRRLVWRERLGAADDRRHTVVAELGGRVVGFAHLVLDADDRWGNLVDNLHVTYELKGRGTGTRLLGAVAARSTAERPGAGLYLWVLAQNTAAQAFYLARGGRLVEERLAGPFPGGGRAPAHRCAWPDPTVLAEAGQSAP